MQPSPAMLQRLSSLRDLPPEGLQSLSDQLHLQEARRGGVLLEIGATDADTLYLVNGACRLIAGDGAQKVIRHTDSSAQAPLARLRPSHYRVVAESDVQYLRIPDRMLEEALGALDQASSLTLETYQVEEGDDLGHMAAENRLTVQIYEDLNAERLLLPSLPDVAIRIGEAVNDDNADARKVANVIETDPAIALKIVKAANSARFGGISQIGTVTEAVARLGLHNTRFLVVTFALRELFRTDSRVLSNRMAELWEHSRRIAAYTRVLGEKVDKRFNPHESLLAGLVHDIGGLAVIAYAREFPEVAGNPAALESSIAALRTQLGSMILSKWQVPPELVTVAKEAENWFRQGSGPADYADLVIVAQLHDGVAPEVDPARVPALERLGLTPGETGQGLDILHSATEEIAAARAQLSG